jgi:hypothetical protein
MIGQWIHRRQHGGLAFAGGVAKDSENWDCTTGAQNKLTGVSIYSYSYSFICGIGYLILGFRFCPALS